MEEDISRVQVSAQRQQYFLQRARQLAFNSPNQIHRHGAVIVKGKKIISEGFNHKRWHLYMKNKLSVHAEIAALSHVKLKYDKKFLSQCDMYVVRLGNERTGRPLKYSKPCQCCSKAILKSGVRRVFYST